MYNIQIYTTFTTTSLSSIKTSTYFSVEKEENKVNILCQFPINDHAFVDTMTNICCVKRVCIGSEVSNVSSLDFYLMVTFSLVYLTCSGIARFTSLKTYKHNLSKQFFVVSLLVSSHVAKEFSCTDRM